MLEQFNHARRTNLMFRAVAQESFRPIVGVGFLSGLLSLGLGVWMLDSRFQALLYPTWWLTLGLTGLVPVVTAGMTALATGKDIRGGQYQLLYMTSLSESELVWGYILRGLYRLRWWMSFLLGIMPLLVVSSFYTCILFYADVATYNSYVQPEPPAKTSILIPTFIFLIFTIGLWGANILGALIGVQAALRWRGELSAGLMAMGLALLCMSLLGIGVALAVIFPQGMQLAMLFCAPSQFILFFTLTWEYFMRRAQLHMRMPEE